MKRILYSVFIFASIITFSGCSDFFDTNPDDILLGDNYVADINEFYSGYMGVAAKAAEVADQFVILSELRGDLLEPTENAPQDLWEIYNYSNDNTNEYANPSGFYDVIVNANDYIRKSIEYRYQNPNAIDTATFNGFMSATIRYKTWAYLCLGKLYGEAIYFDDPMLEYNPDHNFPTLKFDNLISQLLTLMQSGIEIKTDSISYQVNGLNPFEFSEVLAITGSPDVSWDIINPDPHCLNMELNLWAENYELVVDEAIEFLYADGDPKLYKMTRDEHKGEWLEKLFTTINNGLLARERISAFLYNFDNNQDNDLLRFFSNQPPNGYFLRPTQAAMDRHNTQVRTNGIDRGDIYRGVGSSFLEVDGQWVFRKLTHTFEDSPNLVFKTVDNIYMYRQPDIHFFLMEALNNLRTDIDGNKTHFREVEALMNLGLKEGYYGTYSSRSYRYPFNDRFFQVAFTSERHMTGVRGRADLAPVLPEIDSIPAVDSIAYPELYRYRLDSLIVEETCMESGGEAKSYYAMMRMAKRWMKEDVMDKVGYDPKNLVAKWISAKYPEGKREEVENYLMNPDNWYIKFKVSNE